MKTPLKYASLCPGKRTGGFAFAGTMLVLLGVMAILLVGAVAMRGASGLMTMVGSGLQLSSARAQSAGAVALADAGVEMTLQWLGSQPSPPSQTSAFAPALWGASISGTPSRANVNYPVASDSSQSFAVIIYPDTSSSGAQKRFLIESVGSSLGTQATVRVYVQAVSFGHYAYLSDLSSPTSFWSSGVNAFDGPVHCNNSDGAPSSVVWKTGATTPIFQYSGRDAFSVSGTSIRWCSGSPTNISAPATAANWNTVAAPGKSGVHLGTPPIVLPTTSDPQKQAALAGSAVPAQTGVLIPAGGGVTTGGIYIHGDINQITFGTVLDLLGHSTIQQITISQTGLLGLGLTTTITVDPTTNKTTFSSVQLTPGLAVTLNATYTGTTNGVIFCDGSIGGQPVAGLGLLHAGGVAGIIADNYLSGGVLVHASRWTLATDAAKSLWVDGNLVYRTARQAGGGSTFAPESTDTNFTTNAGQLALVSGNVEIGANTLLGIQLLTIEVDAAILAFNTCEAANHSMATAGTFTNVGNFVVKHDGTFGTLDGTGAMVNGYATFRSYDTRLSSTLPPAYPGAGSYQVLSWQNVGAPLT